jgi:hypothetical protein
MAITVVGCALWIGVSAAGAASASLTVSILPTVLTAGNHGEVQATFNNGGARLTGAAIFLTFTSPESFTAGNGCSSLAPRFPNTVVCLLGVMAPNTSATRYVEFTVPSTGPVTVKGVAGFLSLGPLAAGLSKGSASAPVGQPAFTPPAGQTVQTETSDCLGQGGSVTTSFESSNFENGSAGTVVTAGPVNGSPCAPVITGVATDSTGAPTLFVKASQGQQLTVALTFPDQYMPWPANEAGTSPPEGFDSIAGTTLFEWPNYPDTSTQVSVPPCGAGGVIPAGYDSCVVSVQPAEDPDFDSDVGTITVNAVGNGGDGGFHGR